jgi:hypothetical protein
MDKSQIKINIEDINTWEVNKNSDLETVKQQRKSYIRIDRK